MKILLLLLVMISGRVSATLLTFDLRDASIEALDGESSFNYFVGDVIATISANIGVLNRTSSGFGIDVPGNSCDNSDAIDQGCDSLAAESISVSFNQRVQLVSLALSGLTSGDQALWRMPYFPDQIISTSGTEAAPMKSLIEIGDSFVLSSLQDNMTRTQKGFSFDSFTIQKWQPLSLSTPTSLSVALLIVALISLCQYRRSKKATRKL
jgi:hypothetical protein